MGYHYHNEIVGFKEQISIQILATSLQIWAVTNKFIELSRLKDLHILKFCLDYFYDFYYTYIYKCRYLYTGTFMQFLRQTKNIKISDTCR